MANDRARALRQSMTPQEVRLWLRLRQLRAQGPHIRRQVPLHGFVVDFACLKAKLIIEIDGGQHGSPEGLENDAKRDAVLIQAGFRVLRFWNHEVEQHPDDIAETIFRAAMERLPPSGAARHLPRSGEG